MSVRDSNRVSQYTKMLVALKQKLSTQDVETLVFYYRDRVQVPEDKKGDALILFSELERRSDLSEGHIEELLQGLKSIFRDDLHAMCEEMISDKRKPLGDAEEAANTKQTSNSFIPKAKKKKRTKEKYFQQKNLYHYFRKEKENIPSNKQTRRDEVFMELANLDVSFSELDDVMKGGGACIIDPKDQVLAQGKNQTIASCNGKSVPGIEGATDAILKVQAPPHVENCTLYSTFLPSLDSMKLIAHHGIKEVVYGRNLTLADTATPEQYGIKCRKYGLK